MAICFKFSVLVLNLVSLFCRQQFDSTLPAGVTLANFFKDFHLLVFLATQTVSPLFEHMKPLLEAIRDAKDDAVLAWFTSEHWQTLELILQYS